MVDLGLNKGPSDFECAIIDLGSVSCMCEVIRCIVVAVIAAPQTTDRGSGFTLKNHSI